MKIEPVYEEPKRAIFGIRSCDVAGLWHLDRFYLGRDFRDVYYEKRRQNLFLVNVVCTDPARDISEDCFCLCADTGPPRASISTCNSWTWAGANSWPWPARRPGRNFSPSRFSARDRRASWNAAAPFWRKCASSFAPRRAGFPPPCATFRRARSWTRPGRKSATAAWNAAAALMSVPACTCFTVSDRQVGPDEIERVRIWDSCALGGFTRMAGGFNPRRAVHDRRNRRFFRKLAHYFIQRELSMACVGCGRCAAVCHGDIGMPSVVEMIRRAAPEAAAK
jgi:sulfhydrogenase subunit beta (sulfur reductase)